MKIFNLAKMLPTKLYMIRYKASYLGHISNDIGKTRSNVIGFTCKTEADKIRDRIKFDTQIKKVNNDYIISSNIDTKRPHRLVQKKYLNTEEVKPYVAYINCSLNNLDLAIVTNIEYQRNYTILSADVIGLALSNIEDHVYIDKLNYLFYGSNRGNRN